MKFLRVTRSTWVRTPVKETELTPEAKVSSLQVATTFVCTPCSTCHISGPFRCIADVEQNDDIGLAIKKIRLPKSPIQFGSIRLVVAPYYAMLQVTVIGMVSIIYNQKVIRMGMLYEVKYLSNSVWAGCLARISQTPL